MFLLRSKESIDGFGKMAVYAAHTFIMITIVFVAFIVFSSQSTQFSTFKAYSLQEPHGVGPAWEAAARKEMLFRIASGYTGTVSVSSSYSAIVNAIYIRIVSYITNRIPIIHDPEFVDPVLQWFFIV